MEGGLFTSVGTMVKGSGLSPAEDFSLHTLIKGVTVEQNPASAAHGSLRDGGGDWQRLHMGSTRLSCGMSL